MLSDLDLGAERGEEELPKLAAEGLLPPTLVVSGYLDAASEARLLGLPRVAGTLRKPFDMSTLETRIAAALERARAFAPPAANDEQGWIDVVPFERAP
jgi:DNA-binding response OmpR family regulator